MKWVTLKAALCGILLSICFFWCLASIQSSERDNQKIYADYHQAPNCTSTSNPASTLEPCTYEPVQVANRYFAHNEYFVVLSLTSQPRQYVSIYSDLYHIITQGDALTAQEWRGKTRFLIYNNRWYETHSNPDDRNGDGVILRFMLYFFGATFAIVIAAYWVQQRRLLRKGPSAATAEYPLVRDEN